MPAEQPTLLSLDVFLSLSCLVERRHEQDEKESMDKKLWNMKPVHPPRRTGVNK